eukprot:6457100-Amphidinium_carterae.3
MQLALLCEASTVHALTLHVLLQIRGMGLCFVWVQNGPSYIFGGPKCVVVGSKRGPKCGTSLPLSIKEEGEVEAKEATTRGCIYPLASKKIHVVHAQEHSLDLVAKETLKVQVNGALQCGMTRRH